MPRPPKPDNKLKIVSVVVLGNRDESTVLRLAASLMFAVHDPLGPAVLDAAAVVDWDLRRADNPRVIDGKGVVGSVNGHAIVVGNASLLLDHAVSLGDFENWETRLAEQDQRVVFVAVDSQLAAFLSVSMSESSKELAEQAITYKLSGNRKD